MKPSELKELATKIVMNQTDQALLTDALDQIVKAYETNYTVKETLENEKETFETKIKELQDVNMRFFTQLQQPPQKEDEKKEDEPPTDEKELAKLFL